MRFALSAFGTYQTYSSAADTDAETLASTVPWPASLASTFRDRRVKIPSSLSRNGASGLTGPIQLLTERHRILAEQLAEWRDDGPERGIGSRVVLVAADELIPSALRIGEQYANNPVEADQG